VALQLYNNKFWKAYNLSGRPSAFPDLKHETCEITTHTTKTSDAINFWGANPLECSQNKHPSSSFSLKILRPANSGHEQIVKYRHSDAITVNQSFYFLGRTALNCDIFRKIAMSGSN